MGAPAGFGHWEGPNSRGGGRSMGGVTTEEHLVPANRTGLVIGKGDWRVTRMSRMSRSLSKAVLGRVSPSVSSELHFGCANVPLNSSPSYRR